MLTGKGSWLRLLLGLLPLPLVTVLAVVLGTGGDRPVAVQAASTTTTAGIPEPVLREEFIGAYERSRRATWLVAYDFRRRLLNGASLDLSVTYLNRPPDHLISGLGGLNGRVGGRTVVCDDVDGLEICAPEGPVTPFEETLAAEVSELRDVVQPPAKWYAVEGGGRRTVASEQARCFTLRLVARVPSPPYGERAEYCYATADGVPLLNRVIRREGTDERVARQVTRRVDDSDIAALLGTE